MSRIDSIRKLLQSSPSDTFLLYSLGMELLSANQPAEALDQFRKVLQADPGYLAAYEQAAKALLAGGEKPAAAEMLREGIAAAEKKGDRHAKDHMQMRLEGLLS